MGAGQQQGANVHKQGAQPHKGGQSLNAGAQNFFSHQGQPPNPFASVSAR